MWRGEAAALSVRAQLCQSHYFSTTRRTDWATRPTSNPEYEGNISLRNIGKYSPIYEALHLRTLRSSSHWILAGFLWSGYSNCKFEITSCQQHRRTEYAETCGPAALCIRQQSNTIRAADHHPNYNNSVNYNLIICNWLLQHLITLFSIIQQPRLNVSG